MIHTRFLRHLFVQPLSGQAGPAHLSAASGLVRLVGRLYVLADDEHHLAQFDEADTGPAPLIRLHPGDLPPEPAARKAAKPDGEALLWLSPLAGCPHGALLALGSGSRPQRRRGALLPLAADGGAAGPARPIDLAPLLDPLRARLPELNIEGAFIQGETLRLLQRGNGGDGINASIELPWPAVRRWLAEGGPPPGDALITRHRLGAIDGVPLSFTDGAALSDGGWLFSAAAEDTHDTYLDGRCVGSVVGRVGADGVIGAIERLAPVCKVEGIAAWAEDGAIALRLVTDGDDRSLPGLLLAATLTT